MVSVGILSILAVNFYVSNSNIWESNKNNRIQLVGIGIGRLVLGALRSPVNFPDDADNPIATQLRGDITNTAKIPDPWSFYSESDDTEVIYNKDKKGYLFKNNETRYFDSQGRPVDKLEEAIIFLHVKIKQEDPDKVGANKIYHYKAAYRIWFHENLRFAPLGSPLIAGKGPTEFADNSDFKLYLPSHLYRIHASNLSTNQAQCKGPTEFGVNGFIRETGWPYCVKKINDKSPLDSYPAGFESSADAPHGGTVKIIWVPFKKIARNGNYYPQSFDSKAKFKSGQPVDFIYLFKPVTQAKDEKCPSVYSNYQLDSTDKKTCNLKDPQNKTEVL